MSHAVVKRKVVKWTDTTPSRSWSATLSCGHSTFVYDEGASDETKEAIERAGATISCYECTRKAEEVATLEERLRELKKRP